MKEWNLLFDEMKSELEVMQDIFALTKKQMKISGDLYSPEWEHYYLQKKDRIDRLLTILERKEKIQAEIEKSPFLIETEQKQLLSNLADELQSIRADISVLESEMEEKISKYKELEKSKINRYRKIKTGKIGYHGSPYFEKSFLMDQKK